MFSYRVCNRVTVKFSLALESYGLSQASCVLPLCRDSRVQCAQQRSILWVYRKHAMVDNGI